MNDRRVSDAGTDKFIAWTNVLLREAGVNAADIIPEVRNVPIGCFCCAQFIVSREVIHRRPLHFYKILLGQLGNSSYFADVSSGWGYPTANGKSLAIVLEHLWHVIFGYALRMTISDYCAGGSPIRQGCDAGQAVHIYCGGK